MRIYFNVMKNVNTNWNKNICILSHLQYDVKYTVSLKTENNIFKAN